MPYAVRDAGGALIGLTKWPMGGGVPVELLSDDHPDVLAYTVPRVIATPAKKLIDSISQITTDEIAAAKDFDALRVATVAFADDLREALVGYLNLIKG